MIEQNYNQIWHGIKANINIVVNHNFTVWIPPNLLVMKREDQIFAQTMMRSKAHLRGLGEEEEKAKGKDTTPEGGNTDWDIDNFTLDLEDMEASPS